MIKFDHAGKTIKDTFKLSDEEYSWCEDYVNAVVPRKEKISRIIESVWVREDITDNQKALVIFSMGRFYEVLKRVKGDS